MKKLAVLPENESPQGATIGAGERGGELKEQKK